MDEADLEKDLKSIVGDRVTASEFERRLYTADLIHVPGWVKGMFQTMPSAVVCPQTVAQVSAVVSYCRTHGVPLTARGGGSSGLLGAVPKKGGILLDLTGLAGILEIDAGQQVARAEAGITWWQLERKLNRHGLGLMSYPSSAKSATLGGWVMTSGLGIGSLKYGPVYDHVLSAEIVMPEGSIREYSGRDELQPFFASEGMLGIMTRLTLKVRPVPQAASPEVHYFDDIDGLFRCVRDLVSSTPLPYSLEILDHRYLSLLKAAGYAASEFAPRSGLLLTEYEGDSQEVAAGVASLRKMAAQHGGVERDNAEHEWEQRFNILRVRRAAPSLVPSSVVVPVDRLQEFYARMERLKKRPIGLVGYVVSQSECYLMPMLATDDRKTLEYTLALHTPRQLSNLAVSLGGKPGGGIGVWNAPYRKQLLGESGLAEAKRTKEKLDPAGIMNPGMWPQPPLFFRPAAYHLAMGVAQAIDSVLPTQPGKVLAEGLDKELADCVQCGYCMSSCPTRQTWLSSTPRGRILIAREMSLRSGKGDQQVPAEYGGRIFECTLCGRCRVGCSVDIKSPEIWFELRSRLAAGGHGPESLAGLTKTIENTHNIAAKPNERRGDWLAKLKLTHGVDTKRRADVVYFVGCLSSFYPMTQPVARAFAQILDAAGTDFAIMGGEEWCCGFPLLAAGLRDAAAQCMRHNIDVAREMGAKSVVMTCPGCYRVWRDEYHDVIGRRHPFDILHSTQLLARLLEQGKIDIQGLEAGVTYHDPCDLGRNSGIFDEPRYIMGKIPGLGLVELEDNREYCTCCGSGGDLLASNEKLSLEIARRKVEEIMSTGAKTAITACPACIRAMSIAKTATKAPVEIIDITQLVWKAMGK
ncbi:MAG: FAD-binding oxidoreductase [Dehalococcoidia bacterium]|nr:FAD-binding oxidoreductase [Dehalococcoidia bacterium]